MKHRDINPKPSINIAGIVDISGYNANISSDTFLRTQSYKPKSKIVKVISEKTLLQKMLIRCGTGAMIAGVLCSSYSPSWATPPQKPAHPVQPPHPSDPTPPPVDLFAPVGSIGDVGNRIHNIGNVLQWTLHRTAENTVPGALNEFIRDLPPPGYKAGPNSNPYHITPEQNSAILANAASYCLMHGVPKGFLDATAQDARTAQENAESTRKLRDIVNSAVPGLTNSQQFKLLAIVKASVIRHCLTAAGRKFPQHQQ